MVGDARMATVVLFTSKEQTTDLYKALSIRFRHRLTFVEVLVTKNGGKKIMEKYGVKSAPALMVMSDKDGNKITRFEGSAFSMTELAPFLEPFALPAESKEKNLAAEIKSVLGDMQARVESGGVVEILSGQQFTSDVLAKGLVTLVAFLDPSNVEELKRHIATLKEFSQGPATNVKSVVWVSTLEGSALMKFFGGIDPNSVIFVVPKKGRFTVFRGTFTNKGLREFLETKSISGQNSHEFDTKAVPGFGNA